MKIPKGYKVKTFGIIQKGDLLSWDNGETVQKALGLIGEYAKEACGSRIVFTKTKKTTLTPAETLIKRLSIYCETIPEAFKPKKRYYNYMRATKELQDILKQARKLAKTFK